MVAERQWQRRNSTHADYGICGRDRRLGVGTVHLTHPNPPCCSPGLRVGRWEAVQHAELRGAEVAAYQPTRPYAHAHPLGARQPVAHAQSVLSRSTGPCRARGSAPTGPASLPSAWSSISGFPPLPPPPLPPLPPQPPPGSFSFAGSVVIPDQNGGCGASQFLRLFSAGISLDLHGRLLGQRANIGQRWRCSRRRRGRAEPLVTTPPLPGSPLALPALRTPRDLCHRSSAPGLNPRPGAPRPCPFLPRCGPGSRPQRAPCSPLGPASSARSPPARDPSSPRGRTYCCWVSVPPPRSALSRPAPTQPGSCPPGWSPALCGLRTLAPPRPAAGPVADSWGRRGTGTLARGPAGTYPFQSSPSSPGCREALTISPGKDKIW